MSTERKGYKLADGSGSSDYEIGDEFIADCRVYDKGSIVKFYQDDHSSAPLFSTVSGFTAYNLADGKGGAYVGWSSLTPTAETKRKVQARKHRFTINKGDYIDSREFTREECERFCELAVACGHERGEWMCHYGNEALLYLGIENGSLYWSLQPVSYWEKNITTQFREFLDKEKSLKKFSKSDLKDGMRVQFEGINEVFYVCGDTLQPEQSNHNSQWFSINMLNEDMRSNIPPFPRIQRVIDRDGTVLFEREEELKELTLQQIADKFRVDVKQIRIKE